MSSDDDKKGTPTTAIGAGGGAGTEKAPTAVSMSEDRNLFYDHIHSKNVNNVEKLLQVTLPVQFQPSFYKDILHTPNDLCQMAYYKDLFVGVIACLVEKHKPKEETTTTTEEAPAAQDSSSSTKLHLAALSVLAPYRDMGIGSKLLKRVIESVQKHHQEIKQIYLHVQVDNEDAQRFYKKHGFTTQKEVPQYYTRVREGSSDAYLMTLDVNQD